MKNESPIGLATILGLAPAAVAVGIFAVLLVIYGGDVERAQAQALLIVGAVSLLGTAALREWRAVVGAKAKAAAPSDPEPDDGLIPGGEVEAPTPPSIA